MQDFNIQYPPLVEQAYNYMISKGALGITKQTIYKTMVDDGVLNEDGTPTKKALNIGLVEETTDPISSFKAEYPLFTSVDNKYFKVVNGEVVINIDGMHQVINTILADPHAPKWQKEQARNLMKDLYNGDSKNE